MAYTRLNPKPGVTTAHGTDWQAERLGDVVFLYLNSQSSLSFSTSGTQITTTLPVGFRPKYWACGACYVGGTTANFNVSGGVVTVYSAVNTSGFLRGFISYIAA